MLNHHCTVCDAESSEGAVERTHIRSSVRKFRDEEFEIWRCPICHSIHAADEVDLAPYYADYPFHKLAERDGLDWMLRAIYRTLLGRLRAAGFHKSDSMLDFGCGSGQFLGYLAESGYTEVSGYDEYSDGYADASVLDRRYDLVVSQDVVEHVPEPWKHLRQLDDLAQPGGLIAIGTPNAEAIDLQNAEAGVHSLQQPYHRHILSKRALLSVGEKFGWELVKYHPTMYTNTAMPFVNASSVSHYMRCFDNTLDLVAEPMRSDSWKLWSPMTLVHGLFGALYAPETDVMTIYRKPLD